MENRHRMIDVYARVEDGEKIHIGAMPPERVHDFADRLADEGFYFDGVTRDDCKDDFTVQLVSDNEEPRAYFEIVFFRR